MLSRKSTKKISFLLAASLLTAAVPATTQADWREGLVFGYVGALCGLLTGNSLSTFFNPDRSKEILYKYLKKECANFAKKRKGLKKRLFFSRFNIFNIFKDPIIRRIRKLDRYFIKRELQRGEDVTNMLAKFKPTSDLSIRKTKLTAAIIALAAGVGTVYCFKKAYEKFNATPPTPLAPEHRRMAN